MIACMRLRLEVITLFFALGLPAGDDPPPGPPWLRTYAAAKAAALAKGVPVFVYFTKTY